MQEFLAQLSAKGFHLSDVQLDGKIHRFDRNGKGNGWYIGFQNQSSKLGQVYQVGLIGDWKTNDYHKVSSGKLSREDSAAAKLRTAQCEKAYQEERRLKNEAAAVLAAERWERFLDSSNNEYLRRKGIDKTYGTKCIFGEEGTTLVVPMRDIHDNRMLGYQRIDPSGNKRFCPGQRVDGSHHLIGDPDTSSVYLCEGFATGATVHMATGLTVYIAFSAGNLLSVAKALIKERPGLTITVAGDDDRHGVEGKNAGREAATKAAMVCGGTFVMPAFKDPASKGTDFNDVHLEEGLEAVAKQLCDPVVEQANGFTPIGYDASGHYFFVAKIKDIIKISNWASHQFYQLAPKAYWDEMYPGLKGISWEDAKTALVDASQTIGRFDSTRVRGPGVWMDRKRVVVNTGNTLLVDGKKSPMSSLKSQYIYISTQAIIQEIAPNPLTAEECLPLVQVCQTLRWLDPKSGYLIAGWLAVARIAGALPVRPHVWVTGGSGTGKSTIMERLVRNALGSQNGKLYVQGGSTEAGVRQKSRGSAIPLIWDEFETNSESNKARVQIVVEMLRQAWSESHALTLKGSPGGSAEVYNLCFAAIVASIRVNLDNDADRSRFSVIELQPHGNDEQQWRQVTSLLAKITEEFGERLYARMINRVRQVRASAETLGLVLARHVNKRYGDQTGMLLAGYWSLISDFEMTEDDATELVERFDLTVAHEDLVTDERECLDHLLTQVMTLQGPHGPLKRSIGEIVRERNAWELDHLPTYGLMLDNGKLFVPTRNAELGRIYKDTRWTDWNRSLIRLPNAKRHHHQGKRIRTRGILIDAECLS
jgi:putative DNA primase/helicase